MRDATPLQARSPLLILLLVCLALCFDRLVLGPYAVTIFVDALDDMVHHAAKASLFTQYGFTAWNPLSPGGMPSYAGQMSPHLLPVMLNTVLPLWAVNHVWNILAPFMFAYGVARVAREHLEVSPPAALMAGVLFMASLLDRNPQIFFSFAFPLFFCWTHDLCKPGLPLLKRLALTAGLFCIVATSYPVLTLPLYPVFHLFFYLACFRHKPFLGRNVAAIFWVWTGYVLYFMPSIVTLLQYVPFSQRDMVVVTTTLAGTFVSFVQEVRASVRVDNTLLPILLAFSLAFRNRSVRIQLTFALTLLLIGAFFRSEFRVLLDGSLFTKLDIRLAGTMVGFPLALCTALVLDRLKDRISAIPAYWWAATLVIAVLVLKNEARVVRNLLMPAGLVLSAMLMAQASRQGAQPARRVKALTIALCGCLALSFTLGRQNALMAGQARIGQVLGNHPELAEIKRESASEPFRVASLDLHPAIAASYGLETADGRGPLFNRVFKENLRLVAAPQLRDPALAVSFDQFWYALTLAPTTSENSPRYDQTFREPARTAADLNLPMLAALNVRYLLAGHPVQGMEGVATLAFSSGGLGLPGPLHRTWFNQWYELPIYGYRLNDPLPRGRLVSRTLSFSEKGTALAALAELGTEERKTTAVLLDSDRGELPALHGGKAGVAELVAYAPDSLDFLCRTEGPSYLVVANNFDPGWQAEVDGAPTQVIRADNAFQAVYLPDAGEHRVGLRFAPKFFTASCTAAMFGALMIGSLALLGRGAGGSAQPGEPGNCPVTFLPPGSWRAGLIGGGLASALWAAGFGLFILGRFPYPHEPCHYTLVVAPLAALFAALALGSALSGRVQAPECRR